MKIYKFLLLTISVFLALNLSAQKKRKKKHKKIPKNIELIKSTFSFSPFYVNEYSYLNISSRKYVEGGEMRYKPNIIGSVGAKMKIKNFTLSYAYALPQPEKFGKTKALNFVFNFQKRIFGMQLYFIHYNGLYLDTLDRYGIFDDMYKREIDNSFILRPDIKFNNVGFQTHFVMTKSFSINAAFEQTERQKKSAGSFMIMLGANFMGVTNDENMSLILPSRQKFFPRTSNVYKTRNVSVKVAPGIGYSFIMAKYFSLSAILLAGPNMQLKWYNVRDSKIMRWGPWASLYYGGKMAFGYNGKVFHFNLVYSVSQDIIGFRRLYVLDDYDCKTNFQFFREYLKLTVGFRIK